MTSRSPRRASRVSIRAKSSKAAAREKPIAPATKNGAVPGEQAEQVSISPERVLQEYARIAFADLRRVAHWGPDGFVLKDPEELTDADAAAISEIVAGASGGARVKLYDKKAALDALARHLGLFMPAMRRDTAASSKPAEDAREVLARRLARLAAGTAAQ